MILFVQQPLGFFCFTDDFYHFLHECSLAYLLSGFA